MNKYSEQSVGYDKLFAGGVADVVTDVLTLKAGASYVRGMVLGVITTSDLAVPVDSSKSDGSEAAYAILADDINATTGNVVAPVYLTGEFNQAALIFGGTDTAAKHKKELRKIGIFLKSNKS
ncbi:head decoration protein [Paenibacillus albiflavus]|uniref:Head decoration protein n=1 Tax=Paenibacillus albiflavus TaxID=2545760 RepID=A0A4R4E0Y7_9BACL|nr:head decoration protein [Paenibacillus albiflavus]TCZ73049.1 head decoration protein [Paenibacillus albiflavus]